MSKSTIKLKRKKTYYPNIRSQVGARHSFKFSVRAWFNFKSYLVLILLLLAAAVVTFRVVPSAEFNYENPKDTFYIYDTNVDNTDPAALKCAACDETLVKTANPQDEGYTCTDVIVCSACETPSEHENGHVRKLCRDEVCAVCGVEIQPACHTDKNGDFKCDVEPCAAELRTLNNEAIVYFGLFALTALIALIFIMRTISLIFKSVRISTMRLEFYDEVMVWKWGVLNKRHIEKRFIGVYDIKVMPRNRYSHNKTEKLAKYGTIWAKAPGGDYNWNVEFYGVKEYNQLKNYLETRKIAERFDRPRTNIYEDGV